MAQSAGPEIWEIEARLDREEACGRDTTGPRLALRELHWRLEYTGDVEAAAATLARLRRLAFPASDRLGDSGGDFAMASDAFFLELDAAVDRWLTPDTTAEAGPRHLLDRINHPGRLRQYLDSLLVSRPLVDGIDRRKELNFATAGLVRLILRRRPAGYRWDSRLAAVIRRFVAQWQDPQTGFFGADYELGAIRYRTQDLSLTFHMARYLDGRIGYWPQLVDTLLAMRDGRYPNGWLDEGGMTNHNNYDVAVLLRLGWPRMRADQRRTARQELGRMLDWCLGSALAADGTIVRRAAAESLPESYYFTIAFLDTVGFFESAGRFWTRRPLPPAGGLQTHFAVRLAALDQNEPMVRMARDRLGRA